MNFEDFLIESGFTTKDHATWQKNAEARGLVVRKAVHPSGETHDYHTAKDKEGNHRGEFDSKTGSGHLK